MCQGVWSYYAIFSVVCRLPWKELFDPVVALARNGFNITEFTGGLYGLFQYYPDILFFPTATRTAIVWDQLSENIRIPYRNADGSMKVAGDFIVFPELADTLEAISRNGADAFYTNERIAQSIVDTVNASGGIITLEDLRTYTVKLEEPLRTQYNGRLKKTRAIARILACRVRTRKFLEGHANLVKIIVSATILLIL